ncbi:S-adenosyl-L-methionine-dependent methyltransferase [Sanghuangporus baumii]|uniref:S-adenosyl-L-methionine-dependent methyltransferase n=1 Tax=Sanghuangporus baumii TaxID=108892 RepID=A0A9Q5HVQ0_SANBA|nr:S-adenosyl-L-methionine-dependent methyltransferase [Sanghuangporus baumii]
MLSIEASKVHPRSQVGFAGQTAELYDTARPSYPLEALTVIRNALPRKQGLRIVEIASGSGKFTKSLLAHPGFNKSVAEMRCIEPNEGMRSVFTRTVSDPRVSLAPGTFDKIGVPDGWADLIVIAMAFHWCLNQEAALKEFVRVLKPDGVVCLLWNLEDTRKAPWLKQIYDVCMPYRNNTPASAAEWDRWRQIFELAVYKRNFTPAEETTVNFTEDRTLESIIDLFLSWAGVAVLPDQEKEIVKAKIRDIVKRGDGLVWKDEKQGIFETPFVVEPIVIFRKALKEGVLQRLWKQF